MALSLPSSAVMKAGAKSAGTSALRLAAINAGAGGISFHGYQKAYIEVVDPKSMGISSSGAVSYPKLYCQFNPATITITKSASWEASGGERDVVKESSFEKNGNTTIYKPQDPGSQPNLNSPYIEFKGGSAASFSLELLFDTTDQPPGTVARDVRRFTNDLLSLTMGNPTTGKEGAETFDTVEPPKPVMFGWGDFVLFKSVITDVEISFIMFDPDGKPVRATAKVGFLEYTPPPLGSTNPTTRTEPRKTWIVQAGQDLHDIAYAEYGHPSHWRHLADSNNLLNPLKITPGQVLILPPLP